MSFLNNKDGYSPLLDDNGNGIGNEKSDGKIALDYTLGYGIVVGADDPLIGSVSPEQTLAGQASAPLWAKDVTTTGTISRVWAVITPPSYRSDPFTPVTDLPTIDLTYNGVSGQYEAVYEGFTAYGSYDIAIYAKDGNGNMSLPMATKVTQTLGPDIYEEDDTLVKAAIVTLNDASPQVHTFHKQADADWVKFYALAGRVYEIRTYDAGSRADVVIELYDSDGVTRIKGPIDDTGPGAEELTDWTAPKDGVYYIKIRQFDPSVFGESTRYSLKVYRPVSEPVGTVQGLIQSDLDMSKITGALIQAGLGTAISKANGTFTLCVEQGTVNLTAVAGNYTAASLQDVTVVADQATKVTLAMSPAVVSQTFTFNLPVGWSLISLPVEPADGSITTVLQGIAGSYAIVWAYDHGGWKKHRPGEVSDLATMMPGKGYWIFMREQRNLAVTGQEMRTAVSLKAGWNLVGWNRTGSSPVQAALGTLAPRLIWGYDHSAGWKGYMPGWLADLTEFVPGQGYWIKVAVDTEWSQ